MSDYLQLKCPACGHPARVSAAAHAERWQCQKCGVRFEVGASAAPTQPDAGFMIVACACGQQFRTSRANAGKEAKCPVCGQKLIIHERPAPEKPAAHDHVDSDDGVASVPRSRGALVGGIAAVCLLLISAGAFLLGRMTQPAEPAGVQRPQIAQRSGSARKVATTAPSVTQAPDPTTAPPATTTLPAPAPSGLATAAPTPARTDPDTTEIESQAATRPEAASTPIAAAVREIPSEERKITGHEAPITHLAFSPNGRYLASSACRPDAAIFLWDPASGREIRRFKNAASVVVNAFAFSADGNLLLSGDGPRLRLWDVETGREISLLTGHTSDVLCIATSHRGAFAITGGWDKTIRLWDLEKRRELRRFTGHTGKVRAVALAPDDLTFTSAGDDGKIRRWDLASARELQQWQAGAQAIADIAASADGETIAAAGTATFAGTPLKASLPQNPLCIWSLDGREIRRLPAPASGVWSIAFSADGKYLLSAFYSAAPASATLPPGEGRVSLWDVASGEELLRLGAPPIHWQQVCFSPDGRHIVTGGADRTIRFWKLPDEISVEASGQIAESELKSLPAIGKALGSEVTALIEAGKLDEANALINESQRDLQLFGATTQVPLWDNSIAPLLRMADAKRVLLAKKGYVAAAAPGTGTAATQPATKLNPEHTKELVAIRAVLNRASSLIRENKLTAAQSEIFAAQERLNVFLAASGASEWNLAVATVFQLAATRQTELDMRRGVEDSRAAALAEAAKRRTAGAATPAAPATQGLSVGQIAPAFMAATVDGKRFSLQQFRGKWVLIDFWATWCGPCKAEMPNLKDVYDTFGKDRRFAMMSLSIDNQVNDPLNYATQNELGWIQGFLGQGWNSPVLKAYGVHGIPALFLIAPDGKIAATGIRGERIKTTIAQALGRN